MTVGVVALPLALAFGVTSGLGAGTGLVTAIVAGLVAAIFGGSRVQVSGPTGAMTVVLVPIVARYGADGVLVVGLLAGLVLIVLAALRVGRFVGFIPLPVIEGFTLGIAVIIALQQVPAALGVAKPEGEQTAAVAARAVWQWVEHPAYAALAVTGAVVLVMVLLPRVWRSVPASLVAVAAATVACELGGVGVARIGAIPDTLPLPSWPGIPFGELANLGRAAVAVAALAAIETLLSATVADGMSDGERHDPDRELFGQGLANVVAPLFGGMPATAAIARTAVNVRAGAKTRLAAVTHALVLLAVVLFLGPAVRLIPLAALAGVLVVTAVRMVEVGSIAALLRSTRSDAVVLCATTLATVAFDLVVAVEIGIAAAGVLALRQMARTARVDRVPLHPADHELTDDTHRLLEEHVVAYRFDGSLFFGAAHRFLLELTEIADVRVVILRLSGVSVMDATGARVLADVISRLEHRGITVLLSGARPHHVPILETLGVLDRLAHEQHAFPTIEQALEHARRHVAENGTNHAEDARLGT